MFTILNFLLLEVVKNKVYKSVKRTLCYLNVKQNIFTFYVNQIQWNMYFVTENMAKLSSFVY